MHPSSTLRFGWHSKAVEGGGVLGALGSHYIDYCRWLAGDVKEVSATLQTRVAKRSQASGTAARVDADDNFSLCMTMASGALATIDLCATANSQFSSVYMSGTKGALIIRDDNELLGLRAGHEAVPVTAPARYPRRLAGGHRLIGPFYTLVTELLAHLNGEASTVPTFEDGLRVQEVLDAARRSAKSGRIVTLRAPRKRR